MKKLNIRRFDVSQGFDMYTHYEEQYNQNGDCTSVLITAIANLDIIRVEKNGVDVSNGVVYQQLSLLNYIHLI